MEITICYMIIYIIEAFILWQYCSDLFTPKYSKKTEGFILFIAYIILFLLSFLENFAINLLAFMLVNFVIILYLYNVKWYSTIFHASIITTIMTLSELIVLGITSQTSTNYYAGRSSAGYLITYTILTKTIYLLILRLIVRLFGETKENNVKLDKGTLFLDIIPIISVYIALTMIMLFLNVELPSGLDIMISLSTILLLIVNLLVFWTYSNNQKKSREFMELQLQLQKEYDSAEYYKMLLKQDESQKILIHDIKKHLHSIASLNEQGETQKVTAYINQIIHSSDLRDSVHVCDNELLNAILCRYIKNCNEQHISLRADIRSGLLEFLTYDDLTALFCNLLDNAVEAASKIPDSYIELSVTYNKKAALTMITMINSCRKNPFSKETGQLISHKKDNLRHGYGMKSIQRIIKKYNGEMQVYYEEANTAFHTIITVKEVTS